LLDAGYLYEHGGALGVTDLKRFAKYPAAEADPSELI